MARSMTGFGRGEAHNELISFCVELKTVNHRFFEPTIRLSRKFSELENDLRSLLNEKVARGKMDVSVTYEEIKSTAKVVLHEDLLRQYVEEIREAGVRYELKDDLSLSAVLQMPELFEVQNEETDLRMIWEVLKEATENALKMLNAMREREGARIVSDLMGKAVTIEEIVNGLEKSAPLIEEKYRTRLNDRVAAILENMGKGITVNEGILENEVALFADRSCIDEELVRLHSHITELRRLLAQEEPVGRPLDFLLQEFNREANTIGSKAADLSVTQGSLQLKKEIEKVREQIQNLE